MFYAVVDGMPSKWMHPFQQRGNRNFPIAIIPAEGIDELINILKGEKVSSFEDEHEIFLPRVLFSGVGQYDPVNVVYEVGSIHFEIPNGTDGLTLWVKAVPMLEKILA
ncbi:MAG: hypothetical protein Q8N73_01370 [bacterium]|nr:hypothetical protein [bacterium]